MLREGRTSVNLNNSLDHRHGLVFNIQRYSLHDGQGIRTLVFLKGCPMRCSWCSNPESQRPQPELAYNRSKCIGANECSLCIRACPNGAALEHQDGTIRIDRQVCRECFQCADVCPSRALSVFGKRMDVDDVMAEAEADMAFYARSGGGITLSGGEPLAQPGFACSILEEAKQRRMNTAMETCGLVRWADLERACRNLDSILFDIKCMDPHKHARFTNVSNERVLENFQRLCEVFGDLPKHVRTPVVPDFNDTEEEVQAILDFIRDKPGVDYELLPYHRLGRTKYEHLEREYPLGDAVLEDAKFKTLKNMVEPQMKKSQ